MNLRLGLRQVKFPVTFNIFNTNFEYFFSHNLVLFLFRSYNKILLDFFLAHVVFLFLFFLFHNLDLELTCLCFRLGLGNLIDNGVFVPMTPTIYYTH